MAWWLGVWWLIACGGTPTPSEAPARWEVREAFDVPPPPGFVSLDVGPVRTDIPFELGARITLHEGKRRAEAEIVDMRQTKGMTYLTVYAEEAGAGPWTVRASPATVEVRPADPRPAR